MEWMMKEKHCPIFELAVMANPNEDPGYTTFCTQNGCQWWTSAYTTENIEVYDCAIVIGAKKNSEGKIPV